MSKHGPGKAPLVQPAVISEPFESVAMDIVGPLPKGKGGCRYILTCVCLATRWPDAVALRSVTAKAVADGLWQIFSRSGIPVRVLSDQGAQFVGKVLTSMCQWMGIEKVRTSPYHPESNGVVERMHGTLKAVLGKCVEKDSDWVECLPWVLMVLRGMPHAYHGFSPYELIYGFRVRTPLVALHYSLVEKQKEEVNVCNWVMRMSEKVELVRDEM